MRVAIVSNYNEQCGIASYTGAVLRGLREHTDLDVDVIPIDTTLARTKVPSLKSFKRRHFEEIAEKAAQYEAVNIQFENGIFGASDREVLRHLEMILKRCRNVSITMHTADFGFITGGARTGLVWFVLYLLRRQFYQARDALMIFRTSFLQKFLRLVHRYRPALIVHTRREKRLLEKYFGATNVHVHPLAFLDATARDNIRASVDPEGFRRAYGLGHDDRVFALYGFISEYKGHLTAIQALSALPANWKLLIVGGQHPASVTRHELVNPYMKQVLEAIETGPAEEGQPALRDRVKFLGAVSDDDLVAIMAHADVNVFPYLETGQSGSGPASLALEVGSRNLMSRAFVFNELAAFAPDCFERFDIGNHLELAQKIRMLTDQPLRRDNPFNRKYSLESNAQFYRAVMRGEATA